MLKNQIEIVIYKLKVLYADDSIQDDPQLLNTPNPTIKYWTLLLYLQRENLTDFFGLRCLNSSISPILKLQLKMVIDAIVLLNIEKKNILNMSSSATTIYFRSFEEGRSALKCWISWEKKEIQSNVIALL